jgi:hypothetical protein
VHIDPAVAAHTVERVASACPLETVMAFGGEPLLYPDAVRAIMSAARDAGVPCRQVITNGCFTSDRSTRRAVLSMLAQVGVNDLIVSVDAFHQETLPFPKVMAFAAEAAERIPVRISPAWLVSREDDNPYNQKTRVLLSALSGTGIPVGEGNVIYPEGNALRYLSDYFKDAAPINPYAEDERGMRTISVAPNGDVLGDNVYRRDILDILASYTP